MKTILLIMALFLYDFEEQGFLVTATIYHATPEQCNADYLTTASGKKINEDNPQGHRWVAVSRDLEQLGFKMGEKILVENADEMNGVWTIEDRMNKRWISRIDFLVNKSKKGGKWTNVIISLVE
jgi:3D (Asp-Asp-Asp) domain-containing protein